MTEEQKKQTYKIAEHYGIKSQEQVAIEECAELIQAITKSNRNKKSPQELLEDINAIAGEIADVLIMCEQLIHLYGVWVDVQEQIEYKISRQLDRMEKGQ